MEDCIWSFAEKDAFACDGSTILLRVHNGGQHLVIRALGIPSFSIPVAEIYRYGLLQDLARGNDRRLKGDSRFNHKMDSLTWSRNSSNYLTRVIVFGGFTV